MKYYVTTPIYYSNAKPHIGSAYPTIAADVLARYYKQKEFDTHFLTGVAEHGQKMATYAKEHGQTPQEFVDETYQYFKDAWSSLDIEYSDFIRTTEKRHEDAVKIFFEKLKESGYIYEAEYEGLYCVGHESFVKEADLDDQGLCPDHKAKPETVKETNWFFKLSEFAEPLKQAIENNDFDIQPESRRNEVISFIDQGLEDITISRQNVEWAIPIPWDESQTIYVWLDELFNYCSAIEYGSNQEVFKKWWPADVHIVGKDIIKFHCIIWPALLMAIGEEIPKKVFAHGFFTVNGEKISKSQGNAIDPVELVKEYGSDAIRYYLLRDIPFGNDGDFSHDRLKDRYNADLANGLGNLTSRTLNMIEKFWPDFDPSKEEAPTADEKIKQAAIEVDEDITNLNFAGALTGIWNQIAACDELIEETKPWELAKAGETEKLKQVLRELYGTLEVVTEAIAPFMPKTHEKLKEILTTQPLKKPGEPLFARKD